MKKNNNSNKRKGKEITPLNKGFPTRSEVVLIYEDTIRLYDGTSAYKVHVFRGNSLYDPDSTGTGHQPRYFDTYATVYGRYKVLASSLRIEAINASTGVASIVSMVPLTEVVAATTLEEISELPSAITTPMVPIAQRGSKTLYHPMISTKDVCGLLPGQVNDEDWSAGVTSNPSQIWYWSVGAFSADKATVVDTYIRVRFEFHAVFYDRKDITTS